MGKKANPKAKGGAGTGGPAAKRARIELPPPELPKEWARPARQPPAAGSGATPPLQFFLLDIVEAVEEQTSVSAETSVLRLYGVTADGIAVKVHVQGFIPYFFALCPPGLESRATLEDDVQNALEALLQAQKSSSAKKQDVIEDEKRVIGVNRVQKLPLVGYRSEPIPCLQISLAGPRLVASCAKLVERGFGLPGGDAEFGGSAYETNVPYALRFLVDTSLGGGRWVELSDYAGHTVNTDSITPTMDLEARVSSVRAISLDGVEGSRLAPLRILAFEAKVDTDDRVVSVAAVLSVHGENTPRALATWVLTPRAQALALDELRLGATPPPAEKQLAEHTPSPQESMNVDSSAELSGLLDGFAFGGAKSVPAAALKTPRAAPPSSPLTHGAASKMVATPSARKLQVLGESKAQCFAFDDEGDLLAAVADFVRTVDPDVLLVYDLARTLGTMLGRARAGLSRNLGRAAGVETKVGKDGQIIGLEGRLLFDLLEQVQKDHKLTSYSLTNMCDHFLGKTKLELGRVAVRRLADSEPEKLATCVLEDAKCMLQMFEKLHYLYNFVEMARVTGVPISYLLTRGQMVKVQSQILRKARAEGFIVPSRAPTGDNTTFEGGFVMEPKSGFYRAPVATLDFASLYPSIMIAHNLCYSTLLSPGQNVPGAVSESPAKDECGRPHRFVGAAVRRGVLPTVLQELLAARKIAKKELASCVDPQLRLVLNGRQLALKISANSVYGVTGAMQGGVLPCLEVASTVTAYGREMIQSTRRLVEERFSLSNGYGHDAEVVYGDTDSVFVKFGPEGMPLEEAMRLGKEAAELCSAEFPSPIKLEFEKVYRPLLLMNKKRYAGLPFTSPGAPGPVSSVGIETVRRDFSGLVRTVVERTLNLLLRADADDGAENAIAYVRSVVDDLRAGRIDPLELVLSKSLGKGDRADDYGAKLAHVELAEKIRKRDPKSAPRAGERVAYLVTVGPAKAKLYEKAEDPLYALQKGLRIDADHYVEHQLKLPLVRIFEHICRDSQAAEQRLFPEGPRNVVNAPVQGGSGMGAFFKPKPKCLACTATVPTENTALCQACTAKPGCTDEVRASRVKDAQTLRAKRDELNAKCQTCVGPDVKGELYRECVNVDCSAVFQRPRTERELETAICALRRLKVDDW